MSFIETAAAEPQKAKRKRLYDNPLEAAAAAVDDAYAGVKKAEKQTEDRRLFLALAVAECKRQYEAANDKPATWPLYCAQRFPKRAQSDLDAMMTIGLSADPPKALKEHRKRGAERTAEHRKKKAAKPVHVTSKSNRAEPRFDLPETRKAAIRKQAKEDGKDAHKMIFKAQLEDKVLPWFQTMQTLDIDDRIEIANRVIDEMGLKHVVAEVQRLSDIPLDQAA